MSQVSAEDRSSDEPKLQMSTTDKSSEKAKSHAVTTAESSGELELQASSAGKSTHAERSHASTTGASFHEEKEQVNTTPDPVSQTGTTDLSGEPQTATTVYSIGEPQSQVSTTNKSFANEKPLVIVTDKYTGELRSPASTTNKAFGEDKSQESIADKASGEPESPMGTKDKTRDQMSQWSTAANALGESESRTGTAIMSGELQAQASITDMFSKEDVPDKAPDRYFAEKPYTYATNKCLVEGTVDKSTGQAASQGGNTDKCPSKDETQKIAAGKQEVNPYELSHGHSSAEPKLPPQSGKLEPCTTDRPSEKVVPTDESSGELELQTSSTGKSYHAEKSHASTAGESFREEKEPVNTTPDPGSQTGTTDLTGEPQTATTDYSSGEPQSQVSTRNNEKPLEIATDTHTGEPASPVSTKNKSTGQEESQGGKTDKYPSKEESQENITGKREIVVGYPNELRHRPFTHSSTEPKSPRSGKLEPYTPDQPPDEEKSHAVTTDESSAELVSQTGIVIEEKLPTRYWMIGGLTVLVVVASTYFLYPWKGQPPVHQESVLEKFFKEVASLKKDFPGQYEGLWFRSEKILQKHLNTSHPSTPSILILTAAQDGEQTLHCVSKRLAKSYANSLHANWFIVNGPSKSKYDSATSKMQIDDELSSGFRANSRAAVLYRLEALPSGSLLILYKYCDHENAAFKDVALVLTVLLEEESLEKDLSFVEVEEKVKDLLWKRFANLDVGAHNEMDVDKLSGVWSRISHIVLPVLPVRSIESGSCPGIKD